jgi:hypothetical protein
MAHLGVVEIDHRKGECHPQVEGIATIIGIGKGNARDQDLDPEIVAAASAHRIGDHVQDLEIEHILHEVLGALEKGLGISVPGTMSMMGIRKRLEVDVDRNRRNSVTAANGHLVKNQKIGICGAVGN